VRLFIATWPSPEVVEALKAMPRPAVEGVRWTRPDQWHVTLRFLGQVPDPGVVLAGLTGLGGLGPPVVARAGPATAVLGSVLCVPVGGLEGLASAVCRATAGVGGYQEHRPFRGHITVARVQGRPGRGRGRASRLEPMAGLGLDASWEVDRVSLVSSQTRPEGSRYEVLAEVALGAA